MESPRRLARGGASGMPANAARPSCGKPAQPSSPASPAHGKLTYGGRTPMPLEDRAKIFSPFDPLDGFREALRAKEREVEERERAQSHDEDSHG